MSVEQEYVVVLKADANYEEFWHEVETETSGLEYIPNRAVTIVNERIAFERNCHYSLTDEEANLLKQDPRVECISVPPEKTKFKIGNYAQRRGFYVKPQSGSAGELCNWGLMRSGYVLDTFFTATVNDPGYGNIYKVNTTNSNKARANVVNYILDGTGVDVIVTDSGIEWNHPEFRNDKGESRVQRIDWFTTTGLSGTQNANHYRDFDGHGTHVASIAAGRNYGWARNANIYSIKINGLEGSGDSSTGISITNTFDLIKLFHRQKPIDPVTGVKRPTVVNMSWGFNNSFQSLANVFYRGTVRTGSSVTGNAVFRWMNYGLTSLNDGSSYYGNGWLDFVDTWVDDLVKEGVHVVIAAGNWYMKNSSSTDPDWNNYYYETSPTFGPVYYHKGKSPQSANAVIVGAVAVDLTFPNYEQKDTYSNGGTGVDMYAPGSGIVAACSNTNVQGGVTYNFDPSFKQVNLGGTSMASPQVAGVLALYLQMNPGAKPAETKKWLLQNASNTTLYDVAASSNKYFTTNALWGGNKKYLYNPLAISQDGAITNLTLENCVLTLK
jgi:subtilisin family serine protease